MSARQGARRFFLDPVTVCGTLAFLAVAFALCWPGARAHEDEFTSHDWDRTAPTTTFDLKPSPSDPTLLTAELTVEDIGRLAESVHISFLMATYGDIATLESARLLVPRMQVCFASRPGAELKNNEYLTFVPTPSCAPAQAEVSKAYLEVKLKSPARVTLWSHKATTFGRLRLFSGDQLGATILPIGKQLSPNGPAMAIASLLRTTWGRMGADSQYGMTPLSWVMGGAALCFGLGLLLLRRAEARFKRPYLGLLALSFSLSLCYVALIPPFQTADEPDHILTFAQSAAQPALADSALKLAQDTHFERIKFRPDQKFTSRDVDRTWQVPFMPDVYAIDLVTRSIGQRTFWPFLLKHWTITDAVAEVLKFRVLAVVIICLALALLFLSSAVAGQSPYPLFFMVFHAPFVVYITTTPGNYLFVGVGGILVAGAFALTLGGRSVRESLASSLCAGFGTGLCLVAGSAGLFVPAFWLAYLPVLLIGDASDAATRRRVWLIWPIRLGGMALGFYPIWYWIEAGAVGRFLDPLFRTNLMKVHAELWPQVPTWALAGVGAFCVLIGVALGLRPKVVRWLRPPFVLLLAWIIFFPLIRHLRDVPWIEYVVAKPEPVEFVRTVIRAFFTSMMPTSSMDGLVGQSFWSGFGWLEIQQPGWQTGWQRFVAAGLLIWGLVRPDWTKRGVDSFVWLGGLVSQVALVGVTAYGYWNRSYNIHGRYLVVCYLIFFALIFSPFKTGGRLYRYVTCGLLLLHAGVMTTLLFRYFA